MSTLPPNRMDHFIRLAIVAGLTLILYLSVHADAFGWFLPLSGVSDSLHRELGWIKTPRMIWLATGALLLCFRTLLWLRYQPEPDATFETAPSMTVVIPAYNEGAMVAETIRSVVQSNYPAERLEILVVDDGSRDDTWKHIQAAASEFPGRVTSMQLKTNSGKRIALATGFRRARGEILVTIDSDCLIEPGTLLAMAGPFRDPKIGAVGGKVMVHNRRAGIIPRMLQVHFVLSFDLMRAVQSTYRSVNCCPGALSAFRKSMIDGALDAWLQQKFLGSLCSHGDDRSLTNFTFAAGLDSVYQRTAVVFTNVPETYSKLCRMFLRWDRSFICEEIRYAKLVWTRPFRYRWIAVYDMLISNLRYPFGYASLVLLAYLLPSHPLTLLRVLVAIGAVASFNMLYYLHQERSTDFLYGILYDYFAFFTLWWIFPYALFTVRARTWGTR